MVRIRLRRVGAKGQPEYRVVVADSEFPAKGRFLENIGHYNPRLDPPTMRVDAERALYWLGKGALPSSSALRILQKLGIWDQFQQQKAGTLSETGATSQGAA